MSQNKQELKQQLIRSRNQYLAQTLNDALEYILDKNDFPNKEKRQQAKQEIEKIKAANTITALNQFNSNFE